MKNEHIEIVRQGRLAIDDWRTYHPQERLDLSGANLSGVELWAVDLSRADLWGANLRTARFSNANLSDANLAGADLTKSDLSSAVMERSNIAQADLTDSNLAMANLTKSVLAEARLSGADLRHTNMTGVNLQGATMRSVNLEDATLTGADLTGANLSGSSMLRTELGESDLTECRLMGATLTDTGLSHANMTRSILASASFIRTGFVGCQFDEALLANTIFSNCDFYRAIGLDGVRHGGPSTIGLDTIVRSGDSIPEEFLRGAGVPDTIITYVRSLVAEPIQFYTCFISYATADQAFADRLYADLRAKRIRCWYYPEDSIVGRRVWEEIDRSIRVYDKLVVVCSEQSLNSPAVVEEIEKALNKESDIVRQNVQRSKEASEQGVSPRLKDPDVLCPIRIDDYVMDGWQHYLKDTLKRRTIGNFVGWDNDNTKYLAGLNRFLHALDPKSWPALD